jgi:hypothetical protein
MFVFDTFWFHFENPFWLKPLLVAFFTHNTSIIPPAPLVKSIAYYTLSIIMLATRDIILINCHLPDEYIDSAISFDAGTSENQEFPSAKDILTSLLSLSWLRNTKKDTKEDSHVIMTDLSDCHLPDEYIDVPVLCSYYDDDSDTCESEELPSAKDLLSFIVPSHWFRSNDDTKCQYSENLSGTSDMTLNECHLPDEYVDAMVSYDSSRSEENTPPKDRIGSLVTFPWFGSNENATQNAHHATHSVLLLNDCHLPDEYVDVVLSSYGTDSSGRNEDPSEKNLRSKYKETQSSKPSRLLISLWKASRSASRLISSRAHQAEHKSTVCCGQREAKGMDGRLLSSQEGSYH